MDCFDAMLPQDQVRSIDPLFMFLMMPDSKCLELSYEMFRLAAICTWEQRWICKVGVHFRAFLTLPRLKFIPYLLVIGYPSSRFPFQVLLLSLRFHQTCNFQWLKTSQAPCHHGYDIVCSVWTSPMFGSGVKEIFGADTVGAWDKVHQINEINELRTLLKETSCVKCKCSTMIASFV